MNKIYLVIILLVFAVTTKAAVWVVATSGGNYTTIQGAIGAAASGDTIYVLNSAVGSGYQGTTRIKESPAITITGKSLTIMPYYNDTLFFSQSQWTITPSGSAIEVDIVDMNDSAGGVTAGTAAIIAAGGAGPSATSRAIVRILGGQIGTSNSTSTANTSGYINFGSYSYIDLTVYGTRIFNGTNNATIAYEHGSIIGDSIAVGSDGGASAGIAVSTEGTVNGDTSWIEGNIISIIDATGSYSTSGIYWNSNSMFFDMRSNLIYTADDGIYINSTRDLFTPPNKIYNNTIVSSNSGVTYTTYGIYLNPNSTSPYGGIEVENNCLARSVTGGTYDYGFDIANASGYTNLFYNYIDHNYSTTITGTPNTSIGNVTSVSAIGSNLGTGTGLSYGVSNTYPPASTATASTTSLGYYMSSLSFAGINGGNQGLWMSNVDGSANTVGCYGGSYTLSNYFPMFSGSGRVWMTSYLPFQNSSGTAGNTFSIKGTSFDR